MAQSNVTRLPKVVDRPTHAALDYLTTGAFLMLAGLAWDRSKRSSVCAMINGFMVLGVSMFTDYPGSIRRLISFRTHRNLDMVQAAMAASMPTLVGFSDTPDAWLFRAQAANEAMVIGITDWDSKKDAVLDKAA